MEKQLKKDWLRLNANESNKGPKSLETIDFNGFEVNRYPDSDAMQLKLAIANELSTTRGSYDPECAYAPLTPDHLIMGTGSDEVLKLILETFLPKEGVVLAPSPTFSEYQKITAIVKGRYLEMPFEDLCIDIDKLISRATFENADVIFLANPSNPTGQLFTLKEIERLVQETRALIVVDEAYAEFCAVTAIRLALLNPRVIVTRTLSKAYGMASLRLGYAIAQPEIIAQMNALRLTYNISGLSEWLALKALERSDETRDYKAQVVQLRGKALWLLNQLPGLIIHESAANFILIEFEDALKLLALKSTLESAGISVRTFESKSGRLKNCMRLTLTDDQEFVKVYSLLKDIAYKYKGGRYNG